MLPRSPAAWCDLGFARMRRSIASAFGLGTIPHRLRGSDDGAGTLGALLAIPIALATHPLGIGWQIAALAVITLGGWWAAGVADQGEDPGWVVIDEVAGALLGVIGLTGLPFAIGWIVARIADITKRFPLVRAAERLPGATGIMADDLVAGAWGLAAGLAAAAFL